MRKPFSFDLVVENTSISPKQSKVVSGVGPSNFKSFSGEDVSQKVSDSSVNDLKSRTGGSIRDPKSRGKNSRDSKEFLHGKKLGINNYTIKVGNIIDEEEEKPMDSIRKKRSEKSEA